MTARLLRSHKRDQFYVVNTIAGVSWLPRLDCVDMTGCRNVASFASLVHCTSLKELDFGWTAVNDEGIAAIAHLQCLARLRLPCCKAITNFAPLAATKSLTELDLTWTNVGNSGIVAIVRLPRLAVLFSCGCERVSDFTLLNSRSSLWCVSGQSIEMQRESS